MVEERDTRGRRGGDRRLRHHGAARRCRRWRSRAARGSASACSSSITAWPFPEKAVRALAARVPLLVVPEINYGQMSLEVERCAAGRAKTVLIPYAGGGIHTPEMILAGRQGAARRRARPVRPEEP